LWSHATNGDYIAPTDNYQYLWEKAAVGLLPQL